MRELISPIAALWLFAVVPSCDFKTPSLPESCSYSLRFEELASSLSSMSARREMSCENFSFDSFSLSLKILYLAVKL